MNQTVENAVFNIGDYVIKTNSNVCRIEKIGPLDISPDKERLYYSLTPLGDRAEMIYVPVDKAETSLRRVMTEAQAWELINSISEIEELYIENERQREAAYREAIQSSNPKKLVSMLKTMYLRKKLRNESGKKATIVDERFFKLAENNLHTELAFALGKRKDEIEDIIKAAVQSA